MAKIYNSLTRQDTVLLVQLRTGGQISRESDQWKARHKDDKSSHPVVEATQGSQPQITERVEEE